ncbi:MAG: oxidoreductase, partial [Lamprocystis purpurea]|nr:oxidoreductase [Lamprocystis purpurea]
FKSLAQRPLMRSSDALEQGLAEHAAEAWALIQDPKTHVFVAGLGRIATVLDKVMADQAGSADAWKACKQTLIDEKRWSELVYN